MLRLLRRLRQLWTRLSVRKAPCDAHRQESTSNTYNEKTAWIDLGGDEIVSLQASSLGTAMLNAMLSASLISMKKKSPLSASYLDAYAMLAADKKQSSMFTALRPNLDGELVRVKNNVYKKIIGVRVLVGTYHLSNVTVVSTGEIRVSYESFIPRVWKGKHLV